MVISSAAQNCIAFFLFITRVPAFGHRDRLCCEDVPRKQWLKLLLNQDACKSKGEEFYNQDALLKITGKILQYRQWTRFATFIAFFFLETCLYVPSTWPLLCMASSSWPKLAGKESTVPKL